MDERTLRIGKGIERPASSARSSSNLREGLHYVRQTPVVLLAVVIVGAVATVGMNFGVIIPAYAQDVVKTDAAGYGFLMAASGIGSLLAPCWCSAAGRGPHGSRPARSSSGSPCRPGRNTGHAGRARVDAAHRLWLDLHGGHRQHAIQTAVPDRSAGG